MSSKREIVTDEFRSWANGTGHVASCTGSTWRRRHKHHARQAHQRWNAYAETTP